MGLLTFLIFWPALVGLFLLVWPTGRGMRPAWIAAIASAVGFAVSLKLWFSFNPHGGFQFVEYAEWIPHFGIAYRLGIDGISVLLVILTALLTLISVVASFTMIKTGRRGFYASLLFLEAAVIGAFVATDVFLFYVFWEAMLIPMYFLIGIWGSERRIYATIKLVLFTMAGSLLMLVAILWMYQFGQSTTGVGSFNLFDWYDFDIPRSAQIWLFAAFALAFAIKVPMVPFHTWLPDAHVQAPVAGSVMLAGVLLKMGTYGFFRFAIPLFPEGFAAATDVIWILAVIGIVYGALMTLVQTDMKRLIAYSSVSHLGFVMLGLVAFNMIGVSGSLLQQINHGISTGALFLLVGMIYERRHTRTIADYGGIFAVMPVFTIAFLVVAFSSVGLPGTNGFIGEFMILLGAFQERPIFAILATSAVILAAGYMLWLIRRVFFGPITKPENESLSDLNPRELAILVPLVALIIWIGVYPRPILERINPSLESWLEQVRPVQLIERPVDIDVAPFVVAPDAVDSYGDVIAVSRQSARFPKSRGVGGERSLAALGMTDGVGVLDECLPRFVGYSQSSGRMTSLGATGPRSRVRFPAHRAGNETPRTGDLRLQTRAVPGSGAISECCGTLRHGSEVPWHLLTLSAVDATEAKP